MTSGCVLRAVHRDRTRIAAAPAAHTAADGEPDATATATTPHPEHAAGYGADVGCRRLQGHYGRPCHLPRLHEGRRMVEHTRAKRLQFLGGRIS
jgi:hypothetical protein